MFGKRTIILVIFFPAGLVLLLVRLITVATLIGRETQVVKSLFILLSKKLVLPEAGRSRQNTGQTGMTAGG